MGGGQSHPVSDQHNGVDITTCTGAYSVNTYSNIHSGGGNTDQHSSAGGSSTTVGIKANIIPALMNLSGCAAATDSAVYLLSNGVCLQSFVTNDLLITAF
tara:strand:+ start:122 stop:421 length:300 start_codon:yes stop_codon:yes gene_type:complete